jgi:hypothetical protein
MMEEQEKIGWVTLFDVEGLSGHKSECLSV